MRATADTAARHTGDISARYKAARSLVGKLASTATKDVAASYPRGS